MSMTTVSQGRPESRRQVEEFAQQARELRQRLSESQGEVEQARLAFADESGSATAVAEAVNNRDRVQQQLADVEAGRRTLLGQLAPGGANGAGGNGIDPAGVLADQFANPDFAEAMRGIAHSKSQFGDIELGRIDRDALVRMAGGSLQAATGGIPVLPPSMDQGPFQGLRAMIVPPTSFLDLVPSDTVDFPTLPYAQEIPETGDPGPAPAAPGTTKSAAGIGYADATTASTTVAGWVKLNRQSLADVDQLQQAVQSRLLVKLRQALEHQVLTGDGSVSDVAGVPGIRGILNTTGIGSVDATGVVAEPDAILDAIKTCLATGANPNAIVLNLNDWAALLKTKSVGSGEYVANPFLTAASTLWDVAFLPSVAVGAGDAIVIDTRLAMTLLFREGASVRLGLDQDDFTKNRVTALVECRAMLPVWAPMAACEVTNLGAA